MSSVESKKQKFKQMSFEKFKAYVADEEEKGFLHTFSKSGTNLTFFIDDLDKMQYLIDVKHVDFIIRSNNDTTPIFYKNPEVTEYLFNKGLSINGKNENDMTVLLGANYDTAKKLIELGVEFESEDISIRSFIDKPYEKAELILQNGFLDKFNEVDSHIYSREPQLLSLLIDYGMKIKAGRFDHIFQNFMSNYTNESLDIFFKHYLCSEELKKSALYFLLSEDCFKRSRYSSSMWELAERYLKIDLNTSIINGVPWFFNFSFSEKLMHCLNEKNVDMFKRSENGDTLLSYNDFYGSLELLKRYPEMINICNNKDQTFFSVKSREEKIKFIINYIQFSERFVNNEIEQKLCYNIIFPELFFNEKLEKAKELVLNSNKLGAIYIEYEKESFRKLLKNSPSKKINIKHQRI